jgi:predicted dehydrogenase
VKSPGLGTAWGGAWDGGIGPVFLYRDVCGQLTETAIPCKPEATDRFYRKCRAFADAVLSGGPSPVPWQEIIYNQAIVDGILRSSELKKEVEISIPEI